MLSGSGMLSWHGMLSNGEYFQLTSPSSAVKFMASSVSGSVYTPSTSPFSFMDAKLFASPLTSCGYTYDCGEEPVSVTLQEEGKGIAIFPNPAGELVYLNGEGVLNLSYRIVDLSGRTLRSGVYDGSISVAGLSPGAYFMVFDGAKHQPLKFVKGT